VAEQLNLSNGSSLVQVLLDLVLVAIKGRAPAVPVPSQQPPVIIGGSSPPPPLS
jgi:hypothetical protein